MIRLTSFLKRVEAAFNSKADAASVSSSDVVNKSATPSLSQAKQSLREQHERREFRGRLTKPSVVLANPGQKQRGAIDAASFKQLPDLNNVVKNSLPRPIYPRLISATSASKKVLTQHNQTVKLEIEMRQQALQMPKK
jgi:hypothetical protein